ncbi:MAG TPA: tRNA (adenosine(37)-N6)-threonylcarbamoyltransferase complex ATPase subunit type 1 TsaE [Acidimicrobiales bacterium]
MIEVRTKSVDDTRALGAELAAFARAGDLILLEGGLGTGKTAFAQGFARGLGVDEPVTSPAFVLMHTYAGRLTMNHLDVYRLDRLQELVDLGIAEILDDEAVTLVEWGDVVTPALPADFLAVRMEPGESDDERIVRVRAVGPSWPARVRAIREALDRWSAGG